jgi:hypothetical protein
VQQRNAASNAAPHVTSPRARLLAVRTQLTLQCGLQVNTQENGAPLAKPNYQYQKRQKELEKKKKQEEKRKRKLESKEGEPGEPGADPSTEPVEPVAGEETPPAA